MPLTSIIRLVTHLADRSDKGEEDIAAFLSRIADVAESMAEKWELNLKNFYDLKFRQVTFQEMRANTDFLDYLMGQPETSNISNIALLHRSNSSDYYDIQSFAEKAPDLEIEWAKRARRRYKEYNWHDRESDPKNENPFSAAAEIARGVVKTRSELKVIFDDLFQSIEKAGGDDLKTRVADLEFSEVEKRVEMLQQQAAKLRQLSTSFRVKIR